MNDSAALYTPNYDNSLYRGDNTSNCYSFAMGMPVNPLTGEVFINGLQPGVLCGRYGEEGYDLTNQDYLKEVVEADMDAVGMNLSPVASSYVPKENETKMVLYFNSATGDYHWAVYNEDKGKWQQVIGQRTNAVDYYAYESGGCICLDYSKPLGSDPAVVPSSPEQGYTVTQVYVLSPQMG